MCKWAIYLIENIFKQRLALEAKIKEALSKLTGELAGTYQSLIDLSIEERDTLIEEHILYADADDM